jgi:hypothetical protein
MCPFEFGFYLLILLCAFSISDLDVRSDEPCQDTWSTAYEVAAAEMKMLVAHWQLFVCGLSQYIPEFQEVMVLIFNRSVELQCSTAKLKTPPWTERAASLVRCAFGAVLDPSLPAAVAAFKFLDLNPECSASEFFSTYVLELKSFYVLKQATVQSQVAGSTSLEPDG